MRVFIVALCLLATAFVLAPSANADPLPDGCIGKPGSVQACAAADDEAQCAGVGLGLQGATACHRPGGVAVCTSMQGPFSCVHAETVV